MVGWAGGSWQESTRRWRREGTRFRARPDPCQCGLVLDARPPENDGSGRRNGLFRSNKESGHFFSVSLFDLKAVSSSRPANAMTPRADAVKAGRRAGDATHRPVVRPRLDGGEHGVKLARVGLREVALK